MMTHLLIPLLLLCAGLLLLTFGAEGLVEGSLRLSRRLGLSPLVAGLTIVAFGTSCPELGVSLSAAIKGVPDIAIGNVVGSNIANAFLIVGIGAIIRPFRCHPSLVRIEVPFLFVMTSLAWGLALFGPLHITYGLMAVGAFSLYCMYLYRARANPAYSIGGDERSSGGKRHRKYIHLFYELALAVGGLLALVYGSKVFLIGAIKIGAILGVPDLFIGLTITAVGTSLPEIAATVSAARRGSGDVIMGNVIGSNLANLCLVLGITSLIKPVRVAHLALVRDFPMLMVSSLMLLVLVVRGGKIGRWFGLLLISIYSGYVFYIYGLI